MSPIALSPAAEAILDRVGKPPVLGTRFQHQGRTAGLALDCIGLLIVGAAAGRIFLRDRANYPWHASGGRLVESLDEQLVRVPGGIVDALPADVLVFWVSRRKKEPRHVAFLDRDRWHMIHTSADVGKVVRWPLTGTWAERIHGVWRLPGVHPPTAAIQGV